MQIIYLDISNKGVVPTVYAKQGDVGRKFKVVLTDFGIPYYPPNGSAFSVWYSGTSGDGNYTDIGDKSAFFVSENKITVEMIAQMLSVDGAGILCLTLNSPDGSQISSWNIPYICEPVPGIDSEEVKSYYTAFSNAVKDLPYPDASLSAPGKAADAAATGLALEGKAPDGFGLGKSAASASDLNTALNCGFFAWDSDSANTPFNYGMGITLNRFGSRYTQLLFNPWMYGYGEIAVRHCDGTEWLPVELVNPPMVSGEEYRTTERHGGKVVYAMMIVCGTLPNTTNKSVSTKIPSSANVISTHGVAVQSGGTSEPMPCIKYDGSVSCSFFVTASKNISINAFTDMSDCTAYVMVKYTKD